MVKVKIPFMDKHTNKQYHEGDIAEFSDERIQEIQRYNPDLIEVTEERKTSRKKKVE